MTDALLVLPAPARDGANGLAILLFQLVMFAAIFYFILIFPQRREQERHRKMLAAIKKGDEVVTAGGVIGTVIHAEEERLTLRTADTTRLVVERARISRVLSPTSEGEGGRSKVAKEA